MGASAWGEAGDITTNVKLNFDGTATCSSNSGISYTKDAAEVYGKFAGYLWTSNDSPAQAGGNVTDGHLQLSNGELSVSLAGAAAGTKDIVTISFDIAYGYNWKSGGTNCQWFKIVDANGTAVVTEKYNVQQGIMGESSMGVTLADIYKPSKAPVWANKVTYTFTFNYETQKIHLTTACTAATNTSNDFEIDMPLGTAAIASFYVKGDKVAAERGCLFDNLLITTTEGDYASSKTITYAYQDQDENDITAVVTANGGLSSATPDAGSIYTPEYPTSFTDGEWEYDYTYVSGGDAFEVTADATITLVYNKTAHPTTDVTVNYKNGGTTLKSDVVHTDYPVGKATGYALRKYVLDGISGILYQTASAMGAWRTPAAATNIDEALETTGIEDVVFFSEGEEIATKSGTGSTTIASRQIVGRFASDSKICELPAGKYRFYALMHCGNGTSGNVHATMLVKAGTATIGSKAIMARTNNQAMDFNFIIAETSDILVNYGGGSNSGIDYIYIQRLGDATVSPTIGADGYATYSSIYALDFERATGVKGYYTTSATSGKVAMTRITGTAAANEGLFLQKTVGDISIPVVASGSTLTGNLLKATNGSSVAASGGGTYHYVFAKQNGDLGFYNMKSALDIPAGKAYLETTAAISGARLALVFDDETTGINDASRLENSEERTVNRVVYDLQGRRVAQPAKGLYIVGGKKVIVK